MRAINPLSILPHTAYCVQFMSGRVMAADGHSTYSSITTNCKRENMLLHLESFKNLCKGSRTINFFSLMLHYLLKCLTEKQYFFFFCKRQESSTPQ
jgi:hypothetical protein